MRIDLQALWVWILSTEMTRGGGVFRAPTLLPHMDTYLAYRLGAIVVCLSGVLIVFGFVRWIAPTPRQALLLGLLCLVRTVVADVVIVHYVMGNPWGVLLADYNLLHGRLWAVVLLTQALSPYLLRKLVP